MQIRRNYIIILFLFLVNYTVTFAQVTKVSLSGIIKNHGDKTVLSYVNIQLLDESDSTFIVGTVSNHEGRYIIASIPPGHYILKYSYLGYDDLKKVLFVGSLSPNLEIPIVELTEKSTILEGVLVTGSKAEISNKLEKKIYSVASNITQSGGSILQSLQNLPGITVQDNKVQLRGSDKITILIDGKQTALTGFGNQSGLDNIPASAIEKIEIINNPSSKHDANGHAGIINIMMKKNDQSGFNGKIGFTTGIGSLWEKKKNLPDIRPQYTWTPKINPSLSLNFKKNKVNLFLQADNLYTKTLNKNEFVSRTYNKATEINSQLKRNRNTNFLSTKTGLDWYISDRQTLTFSGMFGSEKIIDHGDQPFFNSATKERYRLWQFLEDELKTTVMATAQYQFKFKEVGHLLNTDFNYTFHRENEKYFYDNILSTSKGTDAFKLLSDEQVYDFNLDYIKPLKYGRIETGIKLRHRSIPTNMKFMPGIYSVIDSNAGGWANYKEFIPAVYGNYVFENEKWEAELGLRIEYVDINYDVNPNHNTYQSSGYNYTQPFPNVRLAYKLNATSKFSLFYNRRVDRPNEVDIRIFPKYDDAEIIKVGNPALRPQFTNSIELGYKHNWINSYFYSALYHRFATGTISRISSTASGNNWIYAVFQNAGRSYNTGLEAIWNQKVSEYFSYNINGNLYRNQFNAFTVQNLYPIPTVFSADKQIALSGNLKLNNNFNFSSGFIVQLSAVYLGPDLVPQGKIASRFSIDAGLKKAIQKSKGEVFFNTTDLLNTLKNKRTIQGTDFHYTSTDYYETQVIRLGYSYKF